MQDHLQSGEMIHPYNQTANQETLRYTGAKLDGFWLPEQNRSETKVRIGGTAA
jgi:hypothetical protein